MKQPEDKAVVVHPAAMEVMGEDARRTFPDECCGFFFGHAGAEREVILARPVENHKDGDKRRRFEISPADYMRAERFAVEQGLDLLGVYHSHPLHPAIPSEHDRAVAMPWFSYIILSVHTDGVREVRSWRLDVDRRFQEEALRTLTSA